MEKIKLNNEKFDKVSTVKLTYKGQPKVFQTYNVPITQLFFNDLNGRIATFISSYKANKSNTPIQELSINTYNKKFRQFVLESNGKDRNIKTKNDIQNNGQKVPGVVLEDGRIIDGNRRFALLNELFEETSDGKFAYFETVILPVPETDDDKKAIKLLELEIQIGSDERVGYEPINFLVDIYLDLVRDKLYTDQEFSRIANKKESEVRLIRSKAELMADFLEFWNVPEQFHLANELKLDGPLQELVSIKRKMETDEEWGKYKVVFYTFLFQGLKLDTTRKIRNLGKLYGTDEFERIFEEYSRISNGIYERSKVLSKNFTKPLIPTDIRPLPKEQEEVKKIYDEKVVKVNNQQAILKPLKNAEKAIESLEDIDQEIVSLLDSKSKKKFHDYLDKLIQKAQDWKK
jgi:hypothetical protein